VTTGELVPAQSARLEFIRSTSRWISSRLRRFAWGFLGFEPPPTVQRKGDLMEIGGDGVTLIAKEPGL